MSDRGFEKAPAMPRVGARQKVGIVSMLAIGALVALAIATAVPQVGPVLRVYNVPASSMAPNFPERSYIAVNLAAYGYSRASFDWIRLPVEGRILRMSEPKRGDVIVFRSPSDRRTVFVKRLIGLPGDSVQVKEGRVFLNGAVLQREDMPRHVLKVAYDGPKEVVTWREILPEGGSHAIIETEGDKGFLDDTPVFRVPRQSYFVLGDNRDNSNDSRVAPANRGLGFISDDLLVGKVVGGWGGL